MNENENTDTHEINWDKAKGAIIGLIVGGVLTYNVNSIYHKLNDKPEATTAITCDINKDGIEDIILYGTKYGKTEIVSVFMGMKDSSKTIHYVDAKQLMDQRYQADKNKYNQEKSQLEKQIEQYKR